MKETELLALVELRQWMASGEARRRRQRARLSCREIAVVLGVSDAAVWQWEVNGRVPKGDLGLRYHHLLAALGGALDDEQEVVAQISADLPGLLTAHDMATLTGKSAKVWWKAAREGTSPVPVVRLGRDVLWPREPVLAMLRGEPVGSDPAAEVVELHATG